MPTALIVEDEPEANKLLALLVQLRGYSAVSAFTGNEALEKIQDRLPDIVFLDLMLPDINGYEVCRRLKSRKHTSLIPVVMVTARVAAENREESFCVGADDYIPKPYTPDQIFQAMEDADTWRKEIERDSCGREGVITFGSESDESLRQLAHLRNLLVARTTLDVAAVCVLGDALQELRTSADRWSRQRGEEVYAVLGYQILADRLTFTLKDDSGWLAQTRNSPGEAWPAAFAVAGFDAIQYRRDECLLTFSRAFPPGSPLAEPA
ncbi:MAG: response regulator [Isosphaeraceae bacterium]|nr:response regulator [Isosphaeraceae bacterium]